MLKETWGGGHLGQARGRRWGKESGQQRECTTFRWTVRNQEAASWPLWVATAPPINNLRPAAAPPKPMSTGEAAWGQLSGATKAPQEAGDRGDRAWPCSPGPAPPRPRSPGCLSPKQPQSPAPLTPTTRVPGGCGGAGSLLTHCPQHPRQTTQPAVPPRHALLLRRQCRAGGRRRRPSRATHDTAAGSCQPHAQRARAGRVGLPRSLVGEVHLHRGRGSGADLGVACI